MESTYGFKGSGNFYGLMCLKIGIGQHLLVKVSDFELKIDVRALILCHGHTDRRNLHTRRCLYFAKNVL
jgi:hypothetical protein